MNYLATRAVKQGFRIPSDEEMEIAVRSFGEALRKSKCEK